MGSSGVSRPEREGRLRIPPISPGHTTAEAAVDPQNPPLYGLVSDVGRTVSPFTEMRFTLPTTPVAAPGTGERQVVPWTSR